MTQTDKSRTPEQAAEGFGNHLTRRVASIAAADLLLIGVGAVAEASPLVILIAHILLLSACARWLPPASPSDRTPWTFSLMLLFIAGPPGGAGALLLALDERRRSHGCEALEAWYDWLSEGERPDLARRLHEAILSRRAFKPARAGPRSFAQLIAHGTLAEKQALLGRIALKFHRDFFPLLSLALRSQQSAVRAQAAAVFVKLKDQIRCRLSEARQSGRAALMSGDAVAMLGCARSILDSAESGFLDPSEAREALAEARALCRDAQSSGAAPPDLLPIVCRIVASTGEDDGWLDRLLAAAPASDLPLRQLLARALVATGRDIELHRLMFAREGSGARADAAAALVAEGRL